MPFSNPTWAFAVVEIGGDPKWLLALGGALLAILVIIGVGLYLLVAKTKVRQSAAGTWDIQMGGRLPVSGRTFERIAAIADQAVSRPEMTPEKQVLLDRLDRSRSAALKVYRTLMLAVGCAGVLFAALLFRDATPGNMLQLPAGIVFLLSCGALLQALYPTTLMRRRRALEPGLLDRLKVEVTKAEPTTLTLTDSDVERGAAALSQGLSLEEAARAAYLQYDRLDPFEKRALAAALEQSIKAARSKRS